MALTTVPASLSATALTLTTAAQPNITSVGTLTGLTVSGNIAGTLTTAAQTNITSLGTLTSLTVDTMTLNTGTISSTASNFILDAAGELHLDADDGIIRIRDDGGDYGMFQISNSDFIIRSMVGDKDLIFKGNDGGSVITALTLDMSEGGKATFANDIAVADNRGLRLGSDNDSVIYNDGSNLYIKNNTSNQDIIFQGNDDGSTGTTALTLDMSNAGDATFNRAVTTGGNLAVTGQGDFSTLIYVGNNNSAFAENNLLFQAPGHAYIDHATTGQNIIFRTSNSSSRDTTALTIASTGAATFTETVTVVGSEVRVQRPSGGSSYFGILMDSGEKVRLRNSWSNKDIYFDRDGNVGIGINTPSNILHLRAATPQLYMQSDDGNDVSIVFGDASDASRGQIKYNSTDDMIFLVNNLSEKLRIKNGGDVKINSGNLGIGMDAVQALDIDRTSGLSIRFYQSGTFRAGLQLATTGGQMIGTTAVNDFAIRSQSNLLFASGGNTERMRIASSSGNVGIGTTTPQKTFHVEHTAGASEGILISGASDTVGHTAGILLRAEGGEADSALRAKGGIFFERTGLYGVGKLHLAVDDGNDNNSATISDARVTIDNKGPSVGTGGAVGTFAYNVMMNKSSGGTSGSPYSSSHSGAATVSSLSAPMEYFKTVALINTRAYTSYVNIKTNLTANSIMFLAHFLGYNYNYGNKEAFAGGYTYTSNSILAKANNSTLTGSGGFTVDSYRASDGALCFKLYINHTGYTEGQTIFRFHSHSDTTTRQCTVAAVQIRNDGTNHFA